MRPLFLTLQIAVGGALTAALSAQSVPQYQGISHSAPWPASLNASGRFGRADSGNLTPLPYLDVVQLDGSQAMVLSEPDLGFAPAPISQVASDVATLHGGAPTGRDAVALVSSGGLSLHWYDDAQSAMTSQTVVAGAWSGATAVRTGDMNADGVEDVVGVASDGLTILAQLGSSTAGVFSAGPSFQGPAQINELVLLQWDVDSALELAVLTDLGVELFDADGTSLGQFSAALPGGALCSFGQQGTSRERLVWITAYAPPAQQFLMSLSPLGVDDLVDLGSLDAFAIVSTDYDLDGDDDILISHRYSYQLLWIENQRTPSGPSGPSFVQDPGDMLLFEVEAPGLGAAENRAHPVVADFDLDGDDDVFFASERSDDVTVFRGEAVDEDDLRPDAVAGVYTIDYTLLEGNLTLTVAGPTTAGAGATHLQIDLWRQADIASAVEPVAVSRQELPLPSSWPAQVMVVVPEVDAAFDTIYHIQIRIVGLDGAGATVVSYPSFQGSLALKAADRAALDADEPAGPSFDVSAPVPDEPDYNVGISRRRRLRQFKPGPPPSV